MGKTNFNYTTAKQVKSIARILYFTTQKGTEYFSYCSTSSL